MQHKNTIANSALYLIALIGLLPLGIAITKMTLGLSVGMHDIIHTNSAPLIFCLLFLAGLYLCFIIGSKQKMILLLPLLCMAILPLLSRSDPDKMPRGAIVAFNSPEGCPVNWVPFIPANGRMIIGATHTDTNNENNGGLTQRKLLDTGGAETHRLSVNEMPSHNHARGSYMYLLRSNGRGTYSGRSDDTRGEPNLYNKGAITSAGGNRAHNNMPPFIALYYCQKM